MEPVDLLIAGAGPTACVIAERAATVLGWRSLIVEKRHHIGGNCFDEVHDSGLLLHRYGPHYFRTSSQALVAYLSRFTDWIEGRYLVRSLVRGTLYPFPINLNTLEAYFGRPFTAAEARDHLESIREPVAEPANSEQFVMSLVGRALYEDFYLEYTKKQWGRHPRDLDASVCGRIPVRYNRDDRYTDAPFQKLPADGYTAMFANMIDHPLIEVRLGTDYGEVRGQIEPRQATVYTGPLDEYFYRSLGPLEWRSLDFEVREFDKEWVQPCVQVNYPDARDYTRTVELKHTTGQHNPRSVVIYEYPRADGDPYYPVPAASNRERYAKYRDLADAETRNRCVYFCGRLAEYRYINSDTAMLNALDMFERIRRDRNVA